MRRAVLLMAIFLAVPTTALASDGIYQQIAGVRSAAMGGAHRGLGTSNDTLILNPAGMVMARRYSVDLDYAYSPFDKLSRMEASAVDSKSGPVAGALGYTYVWGDSKGANASLHRIYMSAAYPILQNLGFGITATNVRGTYNDPAGKHHKVSMYTGDVGVALKLGGLGLGFAYQNIIRTKDPKLTPPTLGFGTSYQAAAFTLAFDADIDLRRAKYHPVSYHAGAEYFLAGKFPLRLGYELVPFVRKNGSNGKESIVTGGVGWMLDSGSLELAYTQSVVRKNNWSLVAALKFFL